MSWPDWGGLDGVVWLGLSGWVDQAEMSWLRWPSWGDLAGIVWLNWPWGGGGVGSGVLVELAWLG